MDFLNGLSDDQTALIGCAAALLVSGTIMSLSYYVGRFFHKTQMTPEPKEPHILRMPNPITPQSRKLTALHAVRTETERPLRRAA